MVRNDKISTRFHSLSLDSAVFYMDINSIYAGYIHKIERFWTCILLYNAESLLIAFGSSCMEGMYKTKVIFVTRLLISDWIPCGQKWRCSTGFSTSNQFPVCANKGWERLKNNREVTFMYCLPRQQPPCPHPGFIFLFTLKVIPACVLIWQREVEFDGHFV